MNPKHGFMHGLCSQKEKADMRTKMDAAREQVHRLMSDGQPWSADEIAQHTGLHPITAERRIRELREPRYGSHDIRLVERIGAGRSLYRLINPTEH